MEDSQKQPQNTPTAAGQATGEPSLGRRLKAAQSDPQRIEIRRRAAIHAVLTCRTFTIPLCPFCGKESTKRQTLAAHLVRVHAKDLMALSPEKFSV